MKELSAKLLRLIETVEPRLHEVTAAKSAEPILPGGWSRREVIGHLIDSASNNHQRFVRALVQTSLEFPEYEQSANVIVQDVHEADWELLISLWSSYNRYLAHVVSRFPASKLDTPCRIGSAPATTLGFIAEDYLGHMVHHLEQIGVTDTDR